MEEKMKRNKLTLGALGLILLGVILFAAGIMTGGWPGMSIDRDGIHMYGREEGNVIYELEKTELTDFTAAVIDVEYADFCLIPSDGYYLEYRLPKEDGKPVYDVKDHIFSLGKEREFHIMKMDFDFFTEKDGDYYVHLYVPEDTKLEKLDLNVESGDAELKDLQAERIDAGFSYGTAFMENVSADKAKLDMESGSFDMISCDIGNIEYDGSYGSSKFYDCLIGKGSMDMESGELTLENAALDQMEIRGEYGDVTVSLSDGLADYELILESEYGDIDVPESDMISRNDEMTRYKKNGTGRKSLKIAVESGDILVK